MRCSFRTKHTPLFRKPQKKWVPPLAFLYEISDNLDRTKARRPPENERRAPESPHSRRSKRMATVTILRTPVKHYAHLGDAEGIARLVPGGWVFTPDGPGARRLVAYNDVELFLHGLVSEVEAMEAEEARYGGVVAMVCNPEWRLSRER